MNDNSVFLTNRAVTIAGKPPTYLASTQANDVLREGVIGAIRVIRG
jgi:hypothetical protein